MPGDKLDFNELIKRGNDRFRSPERIHTDYYQCFVIYGRPVIEEIEELETIRAFANIKSLFANVRYGDIITLSQELLTVIENERYVFPYHSKEIFGSQEEAQQYFPTFIQNLIKENRLPKEAINENGTFNDDMIQTAIQQLTLTMLERALPEFQGQEMDLTKLDL